MIEQINKWGRRDKYILCISFSNNSHQCSLFKEVENNSPPFKCTLYSVIYFQRVQYGKGCGRATLLTLTTSSQVIKVNLNND